MDLITVNKELNRIIKDIERLFNKINVVAHPDERLDQKWGSRSFGISINPDSFDINRLNMDEYNILMRDFEKYRSIEKDILKQIHGEGSRKSHLAMGDILNSNIYDEDGFY